MESIGLITKPKLPIKKFYIPDSKKQFYFTRSPVRVWSADFMDKTNDELVENLRKAVEDCLKIQNRKKQIRLPICFLLMSH